MGGGDVDRIGRLVEFLPASRANAQALFGAFVGELDKNGAMAADFYGYHGERAEPAGFGIKGIDGSRGRQRTAVAVSTARWKGWWDFERCFFARREVTHSR